MPDEQREKRMREELAQRRAQRQEHQQHLAAEERERLKKLHWMRCPKCGAELDELEFRGVKIDKCLTCGGAFLDDGELEELAGKPGWFEAMRYFFSGR
jgi:DNA-directed RNA polymerase subunit RPC12/RpoP